MTTINGLPAHALLVHAVVVLIPLSAVLVVLVAVWPAARRRLALPAAILATLALVSVPITTDAGEWLEHHVARTPLVRAHTHLGDDMLPWAIGLFLVAAALAAREILRTRTSPAAGRTPSSHGAGGPVGTLALAVLAVVVALGSTVTVYRIGESGARAAWTGHFNAQANPPEHRGAPG
jgi:hypothetical protein